MRPGVHVDPAVLVDDPWEIEASHVGDIDAVRRILDGVVQRRPPFG